VKIPQAQDSGSGGRAQVGGISRGKAAKHSLRHKAARAEDAHQARVTSSPPAVRKSVGRHNAGAPACLKSWIWAAFVGESYSLF